MGRFCVIGLSHRTAPIDVREQVAYTEEALLEMLRPGPSRHGIAELMIVSTCNRVEMYCALDEARALPDLEQVFLVARSLPTDLRKHLYMYEQSQALEHLFRVASSLDSMIVGEPQIL